MAVEGPFDIKQKWAWFGLIVGLGNLLFIALVVLLLQYDFILGIVFAIVVSVLGGFAVTIYALRHGDR